MVFYFTSSKGMMIYMGKDKYENEDLIKYGLPEDIWFHVDKLSSAHVYLRTPPNTKLDDIPDDVIQECCQLVKANSTEGCKKHDVNVIYTRWRNLNKTSDMEVGAIGFHNRDNLRKLRIVKNNTLVNLLNKTKIEKHPDLAEIQLLRAQEIQAEKKEARRLELKAEKLAELERAKTKELKSYTTIFQNTESMLDNFEVEGTATSEAAEAFEDDFM